jgi:hypothetical protein
MTALGLPARNLDLSQAGLALGRIEGSGGSSASGKKDEEQGEISHAAILIRKFFDWRRT